MSASDSEPESHDFEGPASAAQREITRLQEALARREAEAADQAEQHRRAIAERDAHDSEQFLEERRRETAREDRAREREDAFRRERKEAEDERHRLEEENARQQKMLDSPRFLELPSDSQEPAASAPPHQCDLPTNHLVRDHQLSQPSLSQDRTERIRTPAPNITTEDIRILIEQLGPEETVIANGLQQRMEDLLQLQQQRSGTYDTAHVTSDRREARNRTRGTRDQDPRRRSGNYRSSTERPGAPENHIRGPQVPLVPTGGTQSQVPIGGTQPQDPIVGTQPQDPTSAQFRVTTLSQPPRYSSQTTYREPRRPSQSPRRRHRRTQTEPRQTTRAQRRAAAADPNPSDSSDSSDSSSSEDRRDNYYRQGQRRDEDDEEHGPPAQPVRNGEPQQPLPGYRQIRQDPEQRRETREQAPTQVPIQSMVYLQSAPDIGTFHGRRDDDWQKFKTKLKAHYAATGQQGRQAADQLSRYLDGPAYQFWDTLTPTVKRDLDKVLAHFDKRYADDMKQEYYQQIFDNIMYQGYEKETYDDLSTRIQCTAMKAYPDYTDRQGIFTPRTHVRESYVRRKFYDCLTPDIRKQMFVHFRTREAPLPKQLEYAKILQAAELQTQQDDLPYESIYAVGAPHQSAASSDNLAEIAQILKDQSQQLQDLRQMRQAAPRSRSDQRNSQDPQIRQRSPSATGRNPQQDRSRSNERNMDRQRPRRSTQSQQRSVTFSDEYRPSQRYPLVRPRSADPRPRCFNCNQPGHYARNCYAQPANRRGTPGGYTTRPTSPRPWIPNNRNAQADPQQPRNNRYNQGFQQFGPRYNDNPRNDRYGAQTPPPPNNVNARQNWQGQDQDLRQHNPNREFTPNSGYGQNFQNPARRYNEQPDEHRERRTPMHTMPVQRISAREAARGQEGPPQQMRNAARPSQRFD